MMQEIHISLKMILTQITTWHKVLEWYVHIMDDEIPPDQNIQETAWQLAAIITFVLRNSYIH